MGILNSLLCSHKWSKIHDETTKSQIELLRDVGAVVTEGWNGMLKRQRIIILGCTKCGKLDKTIKEI